FFSSRRRHTRFSRDWSSDVCSSDLMTFTITPFVILMRVLGIFLGRDHRFSPTGNDLIEKLGGTIATVCQDVVKVQINDQIMCLRSEERRVGKEGRSRGWRDRGKRKE